MEPTSKDRLIEELRERVYALEEIESERDAIERELKSTRQRLQPPIPKLILFNLPDSRRGVTRVLGRDLWLRALLVGFWAGQRARPLRIAFGIEHAEQ